MSVEYISQVIIGLEKPNEFWNLWNIIQTIIRYMFCLFLIQQKAVLCVKRNIWL